MSIQVVDPCKTELHWKAPLDPRERAFRWVLWSGVLTTPAAALVETVFTLSPEAVADGVAIGLSWIDAANNLAIAEFYVEAANQADEGFAGEGKSYAVDCWIRDSGNQEVTTSVRLDVRRK